jgi:hypothetical protein
MGHTWVRALLVAQAERIGDHAKHARDKERDLPAMESVGCGVGVWVWGCGVRTPRSCIASLARKTCGGRVEAHLVVAAVPHNDVRLGLGLPQNHLVIDAWIAKGAGQGFKI